MAWLVLNGFVGLIALQRSYAGWSAPGFDYCGLIRATRGWSQVASSSTFKVSKTGSYELRSGLGDQNCNPRLGAS